MGFVVFPAIDIRGGHCVRLFQGDYDLENVYYENPLEPAIRWQRAGAQWLHIIDLDGASQGRPVNWEIIEKIMRKTGLKIQVGGGIRNLETAETYLQKGATRIILSSLAFDDLLLTKKMVDKFGPEKIVVSIDGRQGQVLKEGWLKETATSPLEAILGLMDIGLDTFIYTDIDKDGTLAGPSLEGALLLAKESGQEIIVAGGIGQEKDVLDLAHLANQGIQGAVIGRALYTGDINLASLFSKLKGINGNGF